MFIILQSELTDLVGDDGPDLLQPAPTQAKRSRSPSPQPQSGNSTIELLNSRKSMYDSAIKSAQSTGQTSKVNSIICPNAVNYLTCHLRKVEQSMMDFKLVIFYQFKAIGFLS